MELMDLFTYMWERGIIGAVVGAVTGIALANWIVNR